MNPSRAAGWVAGLALGVVAGRAQVLYDGAHGALPSGAGWSFAAIPGTATQTLTDAGVRLNTLTLNAESAGYARVLAPALDRAAGFALAVRFHLRDERHTRAERAGFSVIVLSADRRGIELGFWEGGVFAQADEPLFSRGESADFAFDAGPVDAVIGCRGDRYQLSVNGSLVLTGPVRDYTAFTGFPDVYETPNLLFLGDNTSSAAAEVELHAVALIRPPRIALNTEGALEWLGVPGWSFTVEGSSDLREWRPVGVAFSPTERFIWRPPAAAGFYRVRFP
jgi:hypothetical protein